jgi:hypothetical protein
MPTEQERARLLWELACERVGVEPFYMATMRNGEKYYVTANARGATKVWPCIGDRTAAWAMLEWLIKLNSWRAKRAFDALYVKAGESNLTLALAAAVCALSKESSHD